MRSPLFVLCSLLSFGCGDLDVAGSVEGATEGVIALSWGQPERGLVHGQGRLMGGELEARVSNRPPPAAFHRGLAVADLVLLDSNADVRLGQPLEERAVASDVVLIFRAPNMTERWWSDSFPEGFSCAQTTIGADGEAGYSPVSCTGLRMRFVDRDDLAERPRRD